MMLNGMITQPLRLLYWVFFKPLTLARYNRQFEIDPSSPNDDFSVITAWRQGKLTPAIRRHFGQMFLALLYGLLMFMPLAESARALWLGKPFSFVNMAIGMNIGLILGVVGGMGVGVAVGVVGGLAVGVVGGLAVGVVGGLAVGVVGGKVVGIVVGMAVGVVGGLVIGVIGGMIVGVVGGLAVGVVGGMIVGVVGGVAVGVVGGLEVSIFTALAFLLGFYFFYFRLLLYAFYLPLNGLSYWLMRNGWLWGYQLCPQQYDEIIWFPLWWLDGQLLLLIKQKYRHGLQEIKAVELSFRQRWAAKRAIQQLSADALQALPSLEVIAQLPDQLAWLPVIGTSFTQPDIEAVARELRTAHLANSNHTRALYLQRAHDALQTLQLRLSDDPTFTKSQLGQTFAQWRVWLEVAQAQLSTGIIISNPYIVGQAVQRETRMFTGRLDLFARIEQTLQAPQPPTLVLYGPRRSGKTSFLRQLPQRLGGDILPIFINLQESADTVQSNGRFMESLVHQIYWQAQDQRGIKLPSLDLTMVHEEPFLAFRQWFTDVAPLVQAYTLFLTFDEFEWLETAIDEGRLTPQLFSFFRNLLQDAGGVRLAVLLAGVRTLDEMKHNWSSYFIHVQALKIGFLNQAEASHLLTQPIADFPLTYTPDALDLCLQLTHCQPYLVQLLGYTLVNHLNQQNRQEDGLTVTAEDIQTIIPLILQGGAAFFDERWKSRTADEQRVLAYLAERALLPDYLSDGARLVAVRRLQKQDLLQKTGESYAITIPLVAEWVRQEKPVVLVEEMLREG